MGLKRGDLIISVNNTKVDSASSLKKILLVHLKLMKKFKFNI